MINTQKFFRFSAALLLLLSLAVFMPDLAYANIQPPAVPHGTCTTDPQFEIPTPPAGQGLVSTIVTEIQNVLTIATMALFNSITGDSGYRHAVTAAVTLYIIFYGILFTFGMVQITMHDFVIRMIKIGVIYIFLTPNSWEFFSTYVVRFFNAGTDDFINEMMAVALNQTLAPGARPFDVVDSALSKAVSAKMAVTLMAMFFTPPYGPIFGMLLAMSMGTFVKSMLTAAWVYLMSLILKALLFGIAPIFFVFLLFARTRYLFDGWLNQVVNATLQPILLFTFFAFFIKLIESAVDQIFMTPVCWTEWADSLRGSPFSVHYWRFALCDGGSCEPYGGKWSWGGAVSGGGPIFPIDVVGILVLVMLTDLCVRFNAIVIMIAADLASASTNLAGMQGALSDWFKSPKGDGGGSGSSGVPTLPNAAKSGAAATGAAAGVGSRPQPGGNVGGNNNASGGNSTGGGSSVGGNSGTTKRT